MNRKHVAVAFVAGVVVAVLSVPGGSAPATQPAEAGQVGRYQLLSGHYQSLSVTKRENIEGLFKIDTRTGRVWEFVQLIEPFKKDGVGGRWYERGDDLDR